MKQRQLLESQITRAWEECILKDYCAQRINSERSLQASFWAHLNSKLSKNRRMFIEPHIRVKTRNGIQRHIPDLIICNTREVIGVIELKYQPRGTPNYSKDIRSLSIIAKSRTQISISNERFRGQIADEKIYSLSKNILFVWAGVHASPKFNSINVPLYSTGHDELSNCFIELHAATNKNSIPTIYKRSQK